jgi:N-acyl-D-aspartate/D-glutamate deacylase
MDIAIKGDKIVATGDLADKASRTIDARGFVVTPGFIDVHTHCDLTFKNSGLGRYFAYMMPSWKGNYNYLYQGVTTVVTGNCGYGYANLDEWFGILDSVGFGTNVYHLAPHGIIREELFGKQQPGGLSAAQLSGMKKRVSEEMEKGAVGLSAGLEYAPGLLTTKEELIALSQVVRPYGGLFTVHMRDESGSMGPGGEHGIIRSIREAIDIARQSQVSVEISHLKRDRSNFPNNSRHLQLISTSVPS